MFNASENVSEALNFSHCKYFLEEDGSIQCYVSDQHILEEIHAYLALSPMEWVISGVYLLVFVAGVGGNLLVCWAVWRNKCLRTVTNFFLTNLAVADVMTILFCLPPSFAQTIWETWFLGDALCKLVTYLQNVAVIVSVLTLTCMSVERWFAICKPLTFRQTKFRVVLCVCGVWLVGLSTSVPCLLVMEESHDPIVPPELTILLTSCKPYDHEVALQYEVFLVVMFFAVPCAVMGYNYTHIAVTLWASSSTGRSLSEGDQSAIASQLMARRRTAKMLVVVVIVFFVCFLPNYVWNIMRATVSLGPINEQVSVITLICQLLVYTNSCTNPIIYNFMSGKFRKEFKEACRFCVRSHESKDKKKRGAILEMEPLSGRRARPRNQLASSVCSLNSMTMTTMTRVNHDM